MLLSQVRLCSAMRHVSLSFHSNESLRDAVDFLRRAHPLSHTAPVKKSQVHHALADMITQVRTACTSFVSYTFAPLQLEILLVVGPTESADGSNSSHLETSTLFWARLMGHSSGRVSRQLTSHGCLVACALTWYHLPHDPCSPQMLWPLVRADAPQGYSHLSETTLGDWYSLLSAYNQEIFNWFNKHDKHIKVGRACLGPATLEARLFAAYACTGASANCRSKAGRPMLDPDDQKGYAHSTRACTPRASEPV